MNPDPKIQKYQSLSMKQRSLKPFERDSEKQQSSSVAYLNGIKTQHQELSAESEKQQEEIIKGQKSLKEFDKKVNELKLKLRTMDSKRDFERNKLKDLELVLSNKEKENNALKEQISKTKSDSQSDLETEHLKCVNIEKEN